jgi:hypothetical protein
MLKYVSYKRASYKIWQSLSRNQQYVYFLIINYSLFCLLGVGWGGVGGGDIWKPFYSSQMGQKGEKK